jgi:hypothetical protein
MDKLLNFFLSGLQKVEQRAKKGIELRVGSMLNKSRVWSLYLVSFPVGLRTYQHPLVYDHSLKFDSASAGQEITYTRLVQKVKIHHV